MPSAACGIASRCGMRRRTANAGVLTYEFKPMAYTCGFSGTGQPAQLTLSEARSTSRVQSMKRERSGEMMLGDVRLAVRSSHALAGSMLETAGPIGYVFERDGRPARRMTYFGVGDRGGSPGAGRRVPSAWQSTVSRGPGGRRGTGSRRRPVGCPVPTSRI